MTRKAENQYISSVHRHLPSENELHREKMHNPYRSGTADWWYSGDILDLWVEYKYLLKLPARDTTIVVPALSALQVDWCTKRFNQGRHVRVVLGTRDGAVIFYAPAEWTAGLSAAECRQRMIDRKTFAARVVAHCCIGAPLVIAPSDGGCRS